MCYDSLQYLQLGHSHSHITGNHSNVGPTSSDGITAKVSIVASHVSDVTGVGGAQAGGSTSDLDGQQIASLHLGSTGDQNITIGILHGHAGSTSDGEGILLGSIQCQTVGHIEDHHAGLTGSIGVDDHVLAILIVHLVSQGDALTGEGVTLADKVYDQYCENMIVYADAAGQARVVVFDVTNRLALDASEQYTFTIAGTTGVTVKDADGNVLVSGTSKVKAGDLLTIEITGTTTSLSTTNAGDITDVAGNYADFSSDTVAAGRTYIAVVTGNVTVTVA